MPSSSAPTPHQKKPHSAAGTMSNHRWTLLLPTPEGPGTLPDTIKVSQVRGHLRLDSRAGGAWVSRVGMDLMHMKWEAVPEDGVCGEPWGVRDSSR